MLKQAPERPRRDLVKKAARAFLLESKQDSLPIDVEALYEPGKYLIFDAEKAEEIAKMSIPIDFWDNDTADAFTCFYNGLYITIYKNKGRTPQRIRFSKAHELGHIVLKHFTEFEQPDSYSIHRSKIYQVLEREADMFAAELLAPTPVLKELNMFDVYHIQTLCDISSAAADITISDLNQDLNVSEAGKNAVLRRFHKYIFTNAYNLRLNELVCPRCNNPTDLGDKYCLVCGTELIKKIHFSPRSFSSARVTHNGRLMRCANCGNDSFRGGQVVCTCGQPLYNKCENPSHTKLLPEYARYCNICGQKTSFYSSGILSSWEDDIKNREQANGYFSEYRDEIPVSEDWHYWVHEILISENHDLYEELKDSRAIIDEDDLVIYTDVDEVPVEYIRDSIKKYCDREVISVTLEKEEPRL